VAKLSAYRRLFLGILFWHATVVGAIAQQTASPSTQPQAPAFAVSENDANWAIPTKNSAGTRYSELAEITAANAKNLQVAFTFSTGVNKGQESSPIVVDDTLYIVSPYPNILYALDLTKPGAPLK
jgi:lanthanide-dependent methanol dehydrogenase